MADAKAAGRPPPREPGARRLPLVLPFSRCGAETQSPQALLSALLVTGFSSFDGNDVTVVSTISVGESGAAAPRLAGRPAAERRPWVVTISVGQEPQRRLRRRRHRGFWESVSVSPRRDPRLLDKAMAIATQCHIHGLPTLAAMRLRCLIRTCAIIVATKPGAWRTSISSLSVPCRWPNAVRVA